MKINNLIALSIITLMSTSCAVKMQDSKIQEVAQKAIDTPETWASKAEKYKDIKIKWIESFNDPMMLKLIKEGEANNIDLKVAAANMDKAWLLAQKAGANLKPTASLSLGGARSGIAKKSSSSRNINIGLTSSWEIDLWGGIEAGVSASQASAESVEADYTFAKHSLSANIAKTYLKVIEAKLQADITRKNLTILTKTMRITKIKYDNGISSGQDLALGRANLAIAKDQLISIEGSQRDALRALEVLLGRYPSATLEIPNVLPNLPSQPPAGVPSQILERRPDIISAERKIAQTFNASQQAKVAHLPQLSLTSTVSGASNALSEILNPANVAWQLGSNLVTTLFDGGRKKIDVKIANIQQKQAISNYAKVALNAFSEVEMDLDQGTVLANREIALNEVLKESNKAYRIANLRYKEGEIELLDALQIQQQAISAQSNLVSIKRLQLEQRINLYLALGGNW